MASNNITSSTSDKDATSSSSGRKRSGFECKKNRLVELISPFGEEPVRQVIYCPYSDIDYLIASRTHNQHDTTIIVADFKMLNDDPQDVQIIVSIITQYGLYGTETVYQLPYIYPMKKEKCFLTTVDCLTRKELWKVEIESGKKIWKKPFNLQSIVEDERGVLFSCSLDGDLMLIDSKSGNMLNKIKIGHPLHYRIGLDVNDNLIIGGYDKNYVMEYRIVTKNGKLIKKFQNLSPSFMSVIDPYKKCTYLSFSNAPNLCKIDSNYELNENQILGFGVKVCGFFFVKDCKYLITCDANNLLVYD